MVTHNKFLSTKIGYRLLWPMLLLIMLSPQSVLADYKVATPAAQNDISYTTGSHASGHKITRLAELPITLTSPKITNKNQAKYYDYYGYENTNDDTSVIYGAPTKQQQMILADYAITLINSYRIKKGLSKLVFGTKIEDATLAEVKVRNIEQKNFEHISFNRRELAPFNVRSLYLSSENLDYFNMNKPTILYAKVQILNIITAMIYQDGYEKDGHRLNFEKSVGMGVALQYNPNFGDHLYQVVFKGVGAMSVSGQVIANKNFNTIPLYTASEILALRRNNHTKYKKIKIIKKKQAAARQALRKKQKLALNKIKKQYQIAQKSYLKKPTRQRLASIKKLKKKYYALKVKQQIANYQLMKKQQKQITALK
ncbi:SEC10/PgrA surface exclusion-like protein [Weissella beninensis]|uniref:SCP domain-containing protein n=1 Tax=Periweissella beninensis TaxID=504936 RepID=A0ABT0VJS9_9LACO|nr:hypothetical protein [Periweissella beninensis]MBM7544860.1 SEC10/PgrA surface exclusion-like protein [Periweissella beninensis]MCM2437139.1 hypothetical protein [Periweissella beninensis]